MKCGCGSCSRTYDKYKRNEMGGCGSGSRTHDKYKRNEKGRCGSGSRTHDKYKEIKTIEQTKLFYRESYF